MGPEDSKACMGCQRLGGFPARDPEPVPARDPEGVCTGKEGSFLPKEGERGSEGKGTDAPAEEDWEGTEICAGVA